MRKTEKKSPRSFPSFFKMQRRSYHSSGCHQELRFSNAYVSMEVGEGECLLGSDADCVRYVGTGRLQNSKATSNLIQFFTS